MDKNRNENIYDMPIPIKREAPRIDILMEMDRAAEDFVSGLGIVPPVTFAELEEITAGLLAANGKFSHRRDWMMVMANNALWRKTVASVPFDRRILLLPQCLRNSKVCKAPVDQYGLLCQGCGGCVINTLQNAAEELGIMCVVAEGTTVVESLIESGAVDAVIGVSCLDALEKSFSHMAKNAVPGLAFPLYNDGCKDTATCTEMVLAALGERAGDFQRHAKIKDIFSETQRWFSREKLEEIAGPCQGAAAKAAREWLSSGGRRFRPFLVAAVARYLGGADILGETSLQKIAVAVECFHKASLIHDDIEDTEIFRYGQDAAYIKWGVPIALNTGDFLLGEGYRLISEADIPSDKKARLLEITARGHLRLCRGQGEDLLWQKQRKTKTVGEILEIMRDKTSPAFEVALLLGSVYAGIDNSLEEILRGYGENLGIAYQLLDDINDHMSSDSPVKNNLSVIDAIEGETRSSPQDARGKALELYEQYRERTLRILRPMENGGLKRLFFKITTRILRDAPDRSDPFH